MKNMSSISHHTHPAPGGDREDSPPSRGDGAGVAAGRGAGPPYPEEVEVAKINVKKLFPNVSF